MSAMNELTNKPTNKPTWSEYLLAEEITIMQ